MSKVVLAYSGGLDTSVAIPWLKEHYAPMRSGHPPLRVGEGVGGEVTLAKQGK